MKIHKRLEGRTRVYELFLDEEDINNIFFQDPHRAISPHASDNARFYLYENPSIMSSAFRPHPSDPEGYFIEIGDETARNAEGIVSFLRGLKRIPIEMESISGAKPINLGYVEIKLEKVTPPQSQSCT